jgi:hypothetical protein
MVVPWKIPAESFDNLIVSGIQCNDCCCCYGWRLVRLVGG